MKQRNKIYKQTKAIGLPPLIEHKSHISGTKRSIRYIEQKRHKQELKKLEKFFNA